MTAPVLAPRGRFRGHEILESRRRHLEPEEVERFFTALNGDDFWQPYFRLTYFWGCRLSEAALVFDEDVTDDQIVIRRLKKREEQHPGGFEEHVYDVPERIAAEVTRVRRWRIDNEKTASAWLFPSFYKTATRVPKDRMGAMRRNADDVTDRAISRRGAHNRFKRAAEDAKLPEAKHLRKTHCLRHTRATLMFAGGATVDQVQFYLGHSNARTTQIYLHDAKGLRARYEHGELAQVGLEGF